MIDQLALMGLAMLIMFVGCVVGIAVKNSVSQIIVVIVTIGALALVPLNCHAMSFQRAKALFSHLENVSGYHVHLALDPDLDFNAWTDSPYQITITQGLLNFCNDAQILSVMGHELGHLDREDYRKNEGSYFQELNADVTGLIYCQRLGYTKKQCISFMYKARKADGEDSGDGVHPGWTQRIHNAQGH